MGSGDRQQTGMDADGKSRIHINDSLMDMQPPAIRNGLVGNVPAFPAPLFSTILHLPPADQGKSKMPLSIMFMGIIFNVLNALMQGGWLFYISSPDRYPASWLVSPQFIVGTAIYLTGMFINIQSDSIIRRLRKPGDTRHYLPRKGMYKYVTSANYLGEIIEWTGFAILTWSWAGAVFAWWTFANLVPRAHTIYKKYRMEFGQEMEGKNLKRIIPFIY